MLIHSNWNMNVSWQYSLMPEYLLGFKNCSGKAQQLSAQCTEPIGNMTAYITVQHIHTENIPPWELLHQRCSAYEMQPNVFQQLPSFSFYTVSGQIFGVKKNPTGYYTAIWIHMVQWLWRLKRRADHCSTESRHTARQSLQVNIHPASDQIALLCCAAQNSFICLLRGLCYVKGTGWALLCWFGTASARICLSRLEWHTANRQERWGLWWKVLVIG